MNPNDVFFTETEDAGTLCSSGRASEGYARYVKLVARFLSSGKFSSTEKVYGHSLTFLFSNALNALVACISHEELRDTSSFAASLESVLAPCSDAKHYDGLVLANCGLGLRMWMVTGDRERAADFYVNCIAAGKAAAAARVGLCEYAKSNLEVCFENLAALRGELRFEPSPMLAARIFAVDPKTVKPGELPRIAPSLCGKCAADFATMTCSRCRAVRYCDAACQRVHWSEHKVQCKTKA